VQTLVPKKPKPINLEQSAQSGSGDLLELVLFAPQGAHEQDFLLGADVRFGTMHISSEDWSKSVEIGLSKATLNLDLAGCEIDPSSHRFGDKKPASAKTRVHRTQISSATSHAGAKASIGASVKVTKAADAEASIRLGGGATRDAKVSSTETQVADMLEEPVIAMSGNRWRFSAVAETYMQSRYSGDETLCKVRVTAPKVRVEGRLTFQPKDIVMIDVEAAPAFLDRFKKSPNQVAIAKVLLSKHLKEINQVANKAGAASIVGWVSTLQGALKNDE
jgi:hypothetical protein